MLSVSKVKRPGLGRKFLCFAFFLFITVAALMITVQLSAAVTFDLDQADGQQAVTEVAGYAGLWGEGKIEKRDTVSQWCVSSMKSYDYNWQKQQKCIQDAIRENQLTEKDLTSLQVGKKLLLPLRKKDSDAVRALLKESDQNQKEENDRFANFQQQQTTTEIAAMQQELLAYARESGLRWREIAKQQAAVIEQLQKQQERLNALERSLMAQADKNSLLLGKEETLSPVKATLVLFNEDWMTTINSLPRDQRVMLAAIGFGALVALSYPAFIFLWLRNRRKARYLQKVANNNSNQERILNEERKERDFFRQEVDRLKDELHEEKLAKERISQLVSEYIPGHEKPYEVDGRRFIVKLVNYGWKKATGRYERLYVPLDYPDTTPIMESHLTARLRSLMKREKTGSFDAILMQPTQAAAG